MNAIPSGKIETCFVNCGKCIPCPSKVSVNCQVFYNTGIKNRFVYSVFEDSPRRPRVCCILLQNDFSTEMSVRQLKLGWADLAAKTGCL